MLGDVEPGGSCSPKPRRRVTRGPLRRDDGAAAAHVSNGVVGQGARCPQAQGKSDGSRPRIESARSSGTSRRRTDGTGRADGRAPAHRPDRGMAESCRAPGRLASTGRRGRGPRRRTGVSRSSGRPAGREPRVAGASPPERGRRDRAIDAVASGVSLLESLDIDAAERADHTVVEAAVLAASGATGPARARASRRDPADRAARPARIAGSKPMSSR